MVFLFSLSPAQVLGRDLHLYGATQSAAGPAEHRSQGELGQTPQKGKSRELRVEGASPCHHPARHSPTGAPVPAARRRRKLFCWRCHQGSWCSSSGGSASPYQHEISSMLTVRYNKETSKNLIYALGTLMESKTCGFLTL